MNARTLDWDWNRDTHHRCFAAGVHPRGDKCHCRCADCEHWRCEQKHRESAERVPLDMRRFTRVL